MNGVKTHRCLELAALILLQPGCSRKETVRVGSDVDYNITIPNGRVEATAMDSTIAGHLSIPLTKELPPYPEMARRLHLNGVVLVKVSIDQDGLVKQASILDSKDEVFNKPCIEAAAKWRFSPAETNAIQIGTWRVIRFRFTTK